MGSAALKSSSSLSPPEILAMWKARPDIGVRELFDVTPDAWQDETLQAFPNCPRIAMKANKGPGKTCTLAWLIWIFLLTNVNAQVAATSINGANLRDGLWKELAFWRNKSPILQAMFDWTTTRIERKHPDYRGTWFASARTWSQSADQTQLGNALAGLHSDAVMYVLDESGGMPVPILMSAEGALANQGAGKIGRILQAGNTNMLEGALYHACVKNAPMWKTIVINGDPDNPKRSPRISLEWARELIKQFGREDPFVKVMVLGEWPAASVNALIGPDEVEAAMNRCYREYQYNGFSKIMGVDVAEQGDDSTVICKRQGIVVFPFVQHRGMDPITGAGAVSRAWLDWNADACFVDNTGGFGSGWIAQLRALGRPAIGVQYAGEAHDKALFYNKRTEMYFDAVRWIKDGGQLPECRELLAALTQTLYTHKGDRLLLEPKVNVKTKIGYSPDHADSFVQTFAEPVTPAPKTLQGERKAYDAVGAYDTFADVFAAQHR